MEIKASGLMDVLMNCSEKKNIQSQDEFSEIFSALLLNILPSMNNQQLTTGESFSEVGSDMSGSANTDYTNNFTINLINCLPKLDSDFTNAIKDLNAGDVNENIGNLTDEAIKFNDLVMEIGEKIEAGNTTELKGKLANILARLEDKKTSENIKLTDFKFLKPSKAINGVETSTPLTVEKIQIHGDKDLTNVLDVKSFDAEDENKIKSNSFGIKEVLGSINGLGDKNILLKSNLITKADSDNNFELSKFITKPEDILEVAVEKFKSLRLPDRTELNLRLRPAELGELTVKLVLEKGQVNGSIMAENKDVVNLLKSQIDGLKQELKNNNVNLSSLNIGHSGDNMLNSGRGGREFSNNSSRSRKYEEYEDLTPLHEEDGFTIMA